MNEQNTSLHLKLVLLPGVDWGRAFVGNKDPDGDFADAALINIMTALNNVLPAAANVEVAGFEFVLFLKNFKTSPDAMDERLAEYITALLRCLPATEPDSAAASTPGTLRHITLRDYFGNIAARSGELEDWEEEQLGAMLENYSVRSTVAESRKGSIHEQNDWSALERLFILYGII